MRRLALVLCPPALFLAACETVPVTPVVVGGPVVVADTTVRDEQAATSVELAYKGARLLLELAVDTGRLTGARAAQAQVLNRRAYAAVQAARAAYKTGNSASWFAAERNARAAVAAFLAAI